MLQSDIKVERLVDTVYGSLAVREAVSFQFFPSNSDTRASHLFPRLFSPPQPSNTQSKERTRRTHLASTKHDKRPIDHGADVAYARDGGWVGRVVGGAGHCFGAVGEGEAELRARVA